MVGINKREGFLFWFLLFVDYEDEEEEEEDEDDQMMMMMMMLTKKMNEKLKKKFENGFSLTASTGQIVDPTFPSQIVLARLLSPCINNRYPTAT